ncbi:MAG: FAD-dependent oxidoreductase, partial [Myxococcales bacterium]|nr:FAD-dependent oxidoreductase [Myxococcales bacterium]
MLPLVGCGDNASGYDVRATVAVVGGGIAGLHCAYRLAEAGVDVVLFEASDRTGGRMYTARDAFPEGQLCELGGELVDTDHEVIQILCGELGLTLDDLPAETAGLRADTFHFDGGVLDEQDLADAFTPLAATMAATVAAAEADDAEFARVDAMSIPAWLEGEAGLAAGSQLRKILEITYTGEYGLEADEQSIFNLLYLIDYDTPDPFHIFGDSDERFHVHEGNDAVPAALAAALPDGVIRLDHALVRVVATGDGYDLSFRTGGGDVAVAATHVVFALPFTKLREVDLVDSGLPADKRTIIDELGYGTNAKLMLGFDTRAWATGSGAAGGSYTDVGELQSTWDSTRGQAGARGILTNFVGGARGLSIGDGSAESQAAIVVPWVDTVFPGAAAAYTADSAVRMHWPTHPFTRGSYACYRPGQWAFFGLEGQRAGDLHFCGEHTSEDFQGYMEGGAETGLAVAMEILDDLGVAPSARAAAIATRVLRRPRATYHAGLWRG